MIENISDFLTATFGVAAGAAFGILCLAFWLTHYVTKKITKITCDHDTITQSHKELSQSLRKIEQSLYKNNALIENVEEKTKKLGEQIDKVKEAQTEFGYLALTIKKLLDRGNNRLNVQD